VSLDKVPDGAVVITPAQMYEQIHRLEDAVRDLARRLDTVPDTLKDHEDRLRRLERRQIPTGVVDLVVAMLAAIALIWQAVGHH